MGTKAAEASGKAGTGPDGTGRVRERGEGNDREMVKRVERPGGARRKAASR